MSEIELTPVERALDALHDLSLSPEDLGELARLLPVAAALKLAAEPMTPQPSTTRAPNRRAGQVEDT